MEIDTIYMDCGYDVDFVRDDCRDRGIADAEIPRRRSRRTRLAIALVLTVKLIDWRNRWSAIR